jgi:hypothetical protein
VVGRWGRGSGGAVVLRLVAQAGAASCGPKVRNQAVGARFRARRWKRLSGAMRRCGRVVGAR